MTTTVRKEIEALDEHTDLIFEVLEDNPACWYTDRPTDWRSSAPSF
jgi:hypothetical protein